MIRPKRLLLYIWAGPASLLGLIFVPLAWISHGQVRIVEGVIEVSGGLVTRFLQNGPLVDNVAAMTLGHVVLGQDESELTCSRQHERVHVAQYEKWGALMIPLYLLSSCWARLRGGHLYWDNRFEQQAYGNDSLFNRPRSNPATPKAFANSSPGLGFDNPGNRAPRM